MALGLDLLSPEQLIEMGKKLQEKTPEELAEFIKGLSPEEQQELAYNEYIWLREKQYVPIDLEQNITLVLAGRGFGKLVSTITEIPTTQGFKKIGDIKIGDQVFDHAGNPCNVTNIYEPAPDVVYELEFDTGEKVVACGDHLWTTMTHRNRKAIGRNDKWKQYPDDWWKWSREYRGVENAVTTKTTQEIIDTFTQGKRGDLNHSIPLTRGVKYSERPLPLEPYIMGAWIGDGSTGGEYFTGIDHGIWDNFRDLGYNVKTEYSSGKTARCYGIKDKLRQAGVLNNKHVPDIYLENSFENRLELLRGLMDTDGYIDPKSGTVEFCQMKEDIAMAVHQLACSFGEKATVYTGEATIGDKSYGTKYRVGWKVNKVNPFRLKRKADVAQEFLERGTAQSLRTDQRMIRSFKRVPVPKCGMRCLEVDSESRMFLITRSFIPTHNTFTGAKWIRQAVEKHGAKRLTLVAPTLGDIKKVMLDGESGLFNMYPDNHPNKPEYIVSHGIVRFPQTKSTAVLVPAESPERARGIQSQFVWVDEPASMGGDSLEFFENILMGTRLYPAQVLITGTPKPTPLILDLVGREGKDVRLVRGSTYENSKNLDERMIKRAKQMENTPLGRQEIHAELALSNPAALWHPDLIEACLVSGINYPRRMWQRVAIGIDPSANKTKSDLTGICVAIQMSDESVVVWEDRSGTYSSEGWTSLIAELFDFYSEYAPTMVVIEQNGVGATWQDILNKHRKDIPVKQFQTTKNKYSRIGQTSYMFETGKVFMNKDNDFVDMQKEMQSWTGGKNEKSPDHLEAMSFAVNELLYKKQNVTKSREILF